MSTNDRVHGASDGGRHLWEIEHPYYGADGGGTVEFENFADLRTHVDGLDPDLNHVYRWDWLDWPNTELADDDSQEQLALYVVMPRKSRCVEWVCPISKDQEAEVLAWLRGPRILGALQKLWEPLLDEVPSSTGR